MVDYKMNLWVTAFALMIAKNGAESSERSPIRKYMAVDRRREEIVFSAPVSHAPPLSECMWGRLRVESCVQNTPAQRIIQRPMRR